MFQMHDPQRHWGCRVNDQIAWCGMRAVLMQNEVLQLIVLIDKGAEIIQFLYKPRDVDFLWRAPNELHNPGKFTAAGGSKSAPFFDHWSGGWFEVVPNNGPESIYKGADLGFYAETTNIPWNYQLIEDTPEKVTIGLWVKTYRTPLVLQKTLTMVRDKPVVRIEEQLINLGAEEIDFAWGHHPVIGPPFLDGDCRISCPDCRVIVLNDEDGPGYRMKLHQEGRWPFVEGLDGEPIDLRIVLSPEAKHMDNCYLTDYEAGWIAVTNTRKRVGLGLAWSAEVFRYVWLWQAYGGGAGFPWFHRAYQLGIEPWSSYPCAGLQEAIRNGSSLNLGPGESLSAWVTATVFESDQELKHINREGKVEFGHDFPN